jgi:hypothetical protein
MAINSKVVCLEKMHNFGIWRFDSVKENFVERGKVLTGFKVQGVLLGFMG